MDFRQHQLLTRSLNVTSKAGTLTRMNYEISSLENYNRFVK